MKGHLQGSVCVHTCKCCMSPRMVSAPSAAFSLVASSSARSSSLQPWSEAPSRLSRSNDVPVIRSFHSIHSKMNIWLAATAIRIHWAQRLFLLQMISLLKNFMNMSAVSCILQSACCDASVAALPVSAPSQPRLPYCLHHDDHMNTQTAACIPSE